MQLSIVQSVVGDAAAKAGVAGFWRQWGAWAHDGHVHSTQASWTLILRGVAASLEAGTGAAGLAGLRAWLPPLDELLAIAEHEDAFRTHAYAAVHPALLCAALHGERLGDWSVAVAVATRLVQLEPFNPLLRTEALRLLCKAQRHLREYGAACDAAERAASDAAHAGCHWLEMLALRDLLRCRRLADRGRGAEEAALWSQLVRCVERLRATPEELAPLMGEDLRAEWAGLFE